MEVEVLEEKMPPHLDALMKDVENLIQGKRSAAVSVMDDLRKQCKADIEKVRNTKVVVSFLGIQNMGKSFLLNRLVWPRDAKVIVSLAPHLRNG